MRPSKNPKGFAPYAPIRQTSVSPTFPVKGRLATCVPLTKKRAVEPSYVAARCCHSPTAGCWPESR